MKWILLFSPFCVHAACPDGYTVLTTSTTAAAINTAVAAGNTCIQGSGTVTLDADLDIPASRTLIADGSVTLNGASGFRVNQSGSNSVLDGFTLIGNDTTGYPIRWHNANPNTGNTGMTVQNCTIRDGMLYVLQNNVGHAGSINDNTFNNARIYAEVIKDSIIEDNSFTSVASKRPIEIAYGSSNTIQRNNLKGGTAGIIFLVNHTINAARKATNGNIVQDNEIVGVTEESISFDLNGDEATASGIREYDTVSSTAGTDQVVLGDADWTGNTTYNTGNYYLGFVTGAQIGTRWRISAQSGATFTLVGMDAGTLATISAGDQIWIGLPAFNNTIRRNRITMANTASSTGIMLWGLAFGNTIGGSAANANFIKNLGAGNLWAVECASLDGMASGTVTGNTSHGRAPCDGNTISHNLSMRGLISDRQQDFGGVAGMYSIAGNSYSNNDWRQWGAVGRK